MNYTLKNESIVAYNESNEFEFPKYTSQLINWANQNAQGTRPVVVGQMSELFPSEDGHGISCGGREPRIGTIDQRATFYGREKRGSLRHGQEPVVGEGGSAFDLAEAEFAAGVLDKVYFQFSAVAVVEEVVGLAGVGQAFPTFGHDEGLEQGTPQGMGLQFL